MTAVNTQVTIGSKQLTYVGAVATDTNDGDMIFTVPAGLSARILARFALPRAATAGQGVTLNNMAVTYIVSAGTLSAATATLVRITYVDAGAPVTSANLLGAPTTAFALATGSNSRAVIPIAAPAIDNQAATSTIVYLMVITFTATAAADVTLTAESVEALYSYVAIPANPTFTGVITASDGISTPSNEGVVYTGALSASGATGVVALNTRVGRVEVTGVGDIAADATANAVILNSVATAATIGIVQLFSTTAAAGSTPRVETVTFGAGTITIALRNSDPATATGAGANYTFVFELFN